MLLGKVVNHIWATQKADSLAQYKLLLVELSDNKTHQTVVAADLLDAGIGDTVILVGGSGARTGNVPSDTPIDATVIGIVDEKKPYDYTEV